ncbi:Hypothetical protein POVN_LOCUS76 [uncultured virus]|nr:Hypothetical protein POVN_LOCUS76 [uncultured virus]
MDGVQTFIELAQRLTSLLSKDNPAEAKALLEWVRADGLTSMRPTLEAFLESKVPSLIEPDDLKCVSDLIKGWTVAKKLDDHDFELTRGTEKALLRLCEDVKELELTQIASKLHIAPPLLGSVTCEEGGAYFMTPLPEATLDDLYETYPESIGDALTLYYNLMKEGNILHNSLYGYNVVRYNNQLYLSNYSEARLLKDSVHTYDYSHERMVTAADMLLDSLPLTYKKEGNYVMQDIKQRTQLWLTASQVINAWFTQVFPDQTRETWLVDPKKPGESGLIDVTESAVQTLLAEHGAAT